MSDIQPGDVVVCLYASGKTAFRKGATYRVRDVMIAPENDEPMLWFHGNLRCQAGGVWLYAEHYRKIRPADPEFIQLLKRVKEPV